MKRFATLAIMALLVIVCCNKAFAGIIYNNTTTPLLITAMQADDLKNLKVGEAQIFHCLGIVDTGNAGIQKAATRAGITKIHHVDAQTHTILDIGFTTIKVYGE